ncbi:hypothetical protein GUJ93_ZPchr0012g19770 [Zizania palustris]|uniref:Uncharacterized protein n=1 Tax=Zizania palustris TaxID=103762 RepID=A0A8J6BS98_ZIZPA|nr:hypothetical protein GUJ93_ZPchr0012g19770 [Zizania palustris]
MAIFFGAQIPPPSDTRPSPMNAIFFSERHTPTATYTVLLCCDLHCSAMARSYTLDPDNLGQIARPASITTADKIIKL